MSYLEEQIQKRMASDERAVQEAMEEIAESVLGKTRVTSDDDSRCDSVIDEILRYYKIDFDPEESKSQQSLLDELRHTDDEERDLFELLEERLRARTEPFGIVFRRAKLSEGWSKSAISPLLAVLDDEYAIALIPNRVSGYSFRDPQTGEKVRVTPQLAARIGSSVFCFYEPLPAEKLTILDILKFGLKNITGADLALLLAAALVIQLAAVILPVAGNYLFSTVAASANLSALLGIAITLVAMTGASFLMERMQELVNTRIIVKQSVSIDSAVMMRVLSMPAGFFKEFSAGELSERISYVSVLCTDITMIVLECFLTFVLSFAQIFVMAKYAPSLVWIVVMIAAATLLYAAILMKRQAKISESFMKESSKEYGVSYSLISGIQKIKLAGAEKRAFAKWGKFYARKAKSQYDPPVLLKLDDVMQLLFILLGTVAIYVVAYYNGVPVADYYAFETSFGIFMSAVMLLADQAPIISSVKPTVHMIHPILDTVPESGSGKQLVNSLRGRIELEHVSFSYDESQPTILDDLSLTIRAGEYVAIVGSTGCGKSTLLKLLLGFETATKGRISFDGQDIASLDIRSLRRKIGTVMQNGKLLVGSIFSNIVLMAPYLRQEDAWEAARIAGIAEDIEAMPMGMHTLVTEGSGGLSGGQKQRLLIARALATKPKILIFDEATSALDTISQKKISDAIDQLPCTRIVVAHRLSTIQNCDRIIVLDKGRIIEQGTYEQLLGNNGFFARLVERQQIS